MPIIEMITTLDGHNIYTMPLRKLINSESIQKILNTYTNGGRNSDVEDFIRHKAIPFEKASYSRTTLVFSDDHELCGYYSIVSKPMVIASAHWNKLTPTKRKEISGSKSEISTADKKVLTAILIGQIGKNFGCRHQIKGDDLMKLVEVSTHDSWEISGGKFAWLEADDKEELRQFYERNNYKKLSLTVENDDGSVSTTNEFLKNDNGQIQYFKKFA